MSITTFHPPYLRYDVPAQLIQIQNEIQALELKAKGRVRRIKKIEPPPTTYARGINSDKTPPIVSNEIGTISEDVVQHPLIKRSDLGEIQIDNPINKIAIAPAVTVSPNGALDVGFNCGISFTAENNFTYDNIMGITDCYWDLQAKNAVGDFEPLHYLGHVSMPDELNHVLFPIDYNTYALEAYKFNGIVTFRVSCYGYNYTLGNTTPYHLPGPFAQSDIIILNFMNAVPCIGLHSVSLNTYTVVGGNNGTDPVMTVTLDAPARPGGQIVQLSVSDSNLANIMNSANLVIPAGQTSGSISWFLGTRRVYTTGRQFNINVNVNSAPIGIATVHLTKQ